MAVSNKIEWANLLAQAVDEPGKINEAYRRFHGYSLGNRIWAMVQCAARGIAPGPLASFNSWKELGRHVKKGEKALTLCMPVACKRKKIDQDGNEIETGHHYFVLKNNWFILSQTEGADYKPGPVPAWSEVQALPALGITKVSFDLLDGNVQGYAAPGHKISVSTIADQPFKTLFHELAHVLLGHSEAGRFTDTETTPRNLQEVEAESVAMLCCASLDLPGIEYSRGYIQSWAEGQPINDKSAQRIFAVADRILKAGTAEPG